MRGALKSLIPTDRLRVLGLTNGNHYGHASQPLDSMHHKASYLKARRVSLKAQASKSGGSR